MMEKAKKPLLGFSKARIITSKRYEKYRDALSALLDEHKTYTYKQVEDILKNFYKKEVK